MAPRSLRFRLVNVFAENSPWSGNALAVIEDARDLCDEEMRAIALQFNLSETAFVLPATTGTARVRIFTPSFELPFAGHPTLGTAYVVSKLRSAEAVTLDMRAGIISATRDGDSWTLSKQQPRSRKLHDRHRRCQSHTENPHGVGRGPKTGTEWGEPSSRQRRVWRHPTKAHRQDLTLSTASRTAQPTAGLTASVTSSWATPTKPPTNCMGRLVPR